MARSSLKNCLTWLALIIPAACSQASLEDSPFESTTGDGDESATTGAGESTGGKTSTGGDSSTGATRGSGGDKQSGEAGETGEGGLGGWQGENEEWPPADGLPEGTFEELLDSDCQIALDRDDDGEADRRWGYEYGPDGELVGEWTWDVEDDLVTKTIFNDKGQPTASCSSEECEQFIYDKKSGGGYLVKVKLHSLGQPPDLEGLSSWDRHALQSEQLATWTFDGEGRLEEVEAFFLVMDVSDELVMHGVGFSLTPAGKFSDFWGWHDYDFDSWSRSASFYPNGSLKSYTNYGTEKCNELGWTVSRHCDDDCYGNWDTDYTIESNRVVAASSRYWDFEDQGFGGMPGRNYQITESTMDYAEDGLSVVVTNSPDDGGPETSHEYLLDPERTEVERDSRGNITVRRSEFTVDRTWGLVEKYTYSGTSACRAGTNPHLQQRPHVRLQPNEGPRTTCTMSTVW